jgi:hypothetical protein
VLPAGPVTAHSAEILGSQRMYRLIQECKAQADVVIFDSPPLLYSDALVLAPQVDGVLLAVNSGTTGRENTINAVESLRLVGAHLIGTVLNRVKAGPAYSYYPAHVTKQLAPALAASPAAPALHGPSIVHADRSRVERALVDGGQPSEAGEGDNSPGEPNPALMTQQLEPLAPSDPGTEMSAEVGAPAVSYSPGEEPNNAFEAGAQSMTANGHHDDHRERNMRRNRGRG